MCYGARSVFFYVFAIYAPLYLKHKSMWCSPQFVVENSMWSTCIMKTCWSHQYLVIGRVFHRSAHKINWGCLFYGRAQRKCNWTRNPRQLNGNFYITYLVECKYSLHLMMHANLRQYTHTHIYICIYILCSSFMFDWGAACDLVMII